MFAVAARAKIERAAVRLSIVSSLLVVTLLLAVYRSVPALALGLLPVATGARGRHRRGCAGIRRRTRHHARIRHHPDRRVGGLLDLFLRAVAPAAAGRGGLELAATLVAHGPPRHADLGVRFRLASALRLSGPAQLGAYSISGLIAAALVTRFVLPALLPSGFAIRDVAPLGARVGALLRPMRRLPGRKCWGSCGLIARWRRSPCCTGTRRRCGIASCRRLSPVSAGGARLGRSSCARDLGAADVRDLVVVSGADPGGGAAGAERAGQALQPLVDGAGHRRLRQPGELPAERRDPGGAPRQPARSAGSCATTCGRPPPAWRSSIERLQPFLRTSRRRAMRRLLTRAGFAGHPVRAGFDALILHQQDRWNALLPLHGAHAAERHRHGARGRRARTARGIPKARVLDLKQESDALYAGYLVRGHSPVAGGLRWPHRAAVDRAALAAAGRARAWRRWRWRCSPWRPGLRLCGVQLTILHLVGMLLIVAVGSNYALFFDRQAQCTRPAAGSLTLASLVIANSSTVIGFGLLVLLAGAGAGRAGHHGGARAPSSRCVRRGCLLSCARHSCIACRPPHAAVRPRAWFGCPARITPRGLHRGGLRGRRCAARPGACDLVFFDLDFDAPPRSLRRCKDCGPSRSCRRGGGR